MLAAQSEVTGFRPDILTKVGHLLQLLNAIHSHPILKGKLVLKGGTALNLFMFDVPRLSIDIDLNYVGEVNREAMIAERPKIERALQAVFSREGFTARGVPNEHAGGKWRLRYSSAGDQGVNLEVDVNFMFRIPLWPVKTMDSKTIGVWQANGIQVMDIHELAVGKLAALLSRHQARDLFDCSRIFRLGGLNWEKLRLAFVVYGAMNRRDWRKVTFKEVALDIKDFEQKLLPTLRSTELGTMQLSLFVKDLVDDCRNGLKDLLPFTEIEMEFLNLVLDKGEIVPDLLTTDKDLQNRIGLHPLLEWKVLNVKAYKDNR